MAETPLKRQKGDRFGIELRNLGRVKRELKEIEKTISGARNVGIFQAVSKEIDKDIAGIATDLRDRIRSIAEAAKVPKRVIRAVFAFTDPNAPSPRRNQRASLVGVRKGAPPRKDKSIYVEWGGTARSGNSSSSNLGMSLATIFETGTSRGITGRRYFSSAVNTFRSTILTRVADAYKKAIDELNRYNGN